MNFSDSAVYSQSQITIEDYLPALGKDKVIQSILDGLTSEKKRISSMFFYDAKGSRLFEDISHLPEYYPTRTEKQLLHKLAGQIGGSLHGLDIVELGSGDCSKITILLNAVPGYHRETLRYLPVDISREAIKKSADTLSDRFSELTIHGIVADFISQLQVIPPGRNRLFCFLGSTIGNLTEELQLDFFRNMGNLMSREDRLLLGIDMVKPKNILERAYNDSAGITAEFNRNILHVVNDIAGTNFDPRKFDHIAFYNEKLSRIEMHLRSRHDMAISCPRLSRSIRLAAGELIHTEDSHKFTLAQISGHTAKAGLKIDARISDANNWFTLLQLVKKN